MGVAVGASPFALTVSRIAAGELTSEHIRRWSQVQQSNELLQSPFFRPEFTQAVAAVRDDIEVAILRRGGEIVGFLPFQRRYRWLGRPVAAGLNDFQGIICNPTCRVDPNQLLRACGLLTWKFDHLIVAQPALEGYAWHRRPSPYLNVADGFTAFLANRPSASRRIRGTLQKARKLEREHGPTRFVAHATDPSVFQFLRERKSIQCRRTGAGDVFSFPWAVQLLERLNREQGPDCCGMLSALYAGERLIAVHQGLRSRSVLHCWITTYERSLASFSPGWMLFVRLAQEAQSLGIRRIELGAGPEEYKESLASDATMLACGSLTFTQLFRDVQRELYRTKAWVKSSPLRSPAQAVTNWIRPLRGWLALR
jgi:CelD/BcsL family acetyltransferase involved in cellulose biosynthesis